MPIMNLDYLAGMMDADGHFTWRGGRYQAPVIGVTNTSTVLMDLLVSRYGGAYSTERQHCPEGCTEQHVHRRVDIHRWQVTGYRAVLLCEVLVPRLHIKADRARQVAQQYRAVVLVGPGARRRETHMTREQARWIKENHE